MNDDITPSSGINASKYIPRKTAGYYCLAVVLFLGLLISLIILLPQVRQFILSMYEQHIKHGKLTNPFWTKSLYTLGIIGIVLTTSLGFLLLTPPGRKLINKTEPEDIANNQFYFYLGSLKEFFLSANFFTGFAFLSGFIVFSFTLFRAGNTGLTYDEAFTYLNYVLPNIFDSMLKNQLLNNHLLNSLLIRVVTFFSQAKYNELLIRFPNLVFYCIYLFFSYLIAKQYKNRFFVFVLFISNYYLNEFFGLARGYGMACACIAASCYFFEKWKFNWLSKEPDTFNFLCFISFCLLGALSNSITLYCVLGFLLIINFKYKKDILKLPYLPFYIIFFLTASHTILVSIGPVYSTHSIYFGIMSIPNMFSNATYLSFLIAVLFYLTFAYLMIKTRAKDDYCWLLIIFTGICIVSQLVFHKGYPATREMIPFYPIFVIVIANSIEYTPNYKIIKFVYLVCTAILCFQFILKIDTKSTPKYQKDDYLIRNTIFTYIASHDIITNREEFLTFIKINQESQQGNPVFTFYAEKAELYLENSAEE